MMVIVASEEHPMSGDLADRANREVVSSTEAEIAVICMKADGYGAPHIKPGQTRNCWMCGEPISEQRLKVLPRTDICKDCKEKES